MRWLVHAVIYFLYQYKKQKLKIQRGGAQVNFGETQRTRFYQKMFEHHMSIGLIPLWRQMFSEMSINRFTLNQKFPPAAGQRLTYRNDTNWHESDIDDNLELDLFNCTIRSAISTILTQIWIIPWSIRTHKRKRPLKGKITSKMMKS